MIPYQCVLSILPNLSYSTRMKLSKVSMDIRKIHQRLPFSLRTVKFHQKRGRVDENGDPEEVGSGLLQVESIEYNFRYDEDTQRVNITCSLLPGSLQFSLHISAARKYFQYYLNVSKRQVQHVHVVESDDPFRDMVSLRLPSLKWTLNGATEFPQFAYFPADHIFEQLELHCFGAIILTETLVKNCKHLVLRNSQIFNEFVIGNEENSIRQFYCTLNNKKLDVVIGLNYIESFLLFCNHLLSNTVYVGSSFTGIYNADELREAYMWDSLLKHFENSAKGIIRGKECVVLELTNEYIVAVFHNYFNEDTIVNESFTAFKLERKMETEVEEVLNECLEVI